MKNNETGIMANIYSIIGRNGRFIKYGIIGGIGTVVNMLAFYLLIHYAGIHYVIASAMATELAIIFNFIGNTIFTFKDHVDGKGIGSRFFSFQLISISTVIGTALVLWGLASAFGKEHILIWNIVAILSMFVLNYLLNVRYTWNKQKAAARESKRLAGKAFIAAAIILLVPHASSGIQMQDTINEVFLATILLPIENPSDNIYPLHNVEMAKNANSNGNNKNKDAKASAATNSTSSNTTPDTPSTGTGSPNQTVTPIDTNSTSTNTTTDPANGSNSTTGSNVTTGVNLTQNTTQNITLNSSTGNITLPPLTNSSINTTTNSSINQTGNGTLPQNTTIQNSSIQNITSNTTANNTIGNSTAGNNTTTNNMTGNNTAGSNSSGQTNITTPLDPALNMTTTDSGKYGSIVSSTVDSHYNSTQGFYIYDVESATFNVRLNASSDVKWYVNNVLAKEDTGSSSKFVFMPGIVGEGSYNITVVAGSTYAWEMTVIDAANPFFSAIGNKPDVVGSADTEVHIFTNNNIVLFSYLNVSILNTRSSSISSYSLYPNVWMNTTDWYAQIAGIGYGNNYLVNVEGYDVLRGKVLAFNLSTERGHYRNPPLESTSRGGGSGGSQLDRQPRVVYVNIGNSILTINQSQNITLDASYFLGGIDAVQATISPPAGAAMNISLVRITGTKEYGTWYTSISGLQPGAYAITYVSLYQKGTLVLKTAVENRSFYVTDGKLLSEENLTLIYTSLSGNIVKNGTTITFKLDASDALGITNASAVISNSKQGNFTVALSRAKGNAQYGSWEGSFTAAQDDSTYDVISVSLSNGRYTKTYPIEDRSVYVQPVFSKFSLPKAQSPSADSTGPPLFSLQFMQEAIRKPLVPALIGFIMLFVVLAVVNMVPKTETTKENP